MSFTPGTTRTPTDIRDIEIRMTSFKDDAGIITDAVQFELQIEYDNGDIETQSGDLLPELQGGELSQLRGIMTSIRARAAAAILP